MLNIFGKIGLVFASVSLAGNLMPAKTYKIEPIVAETEPTSIVAETEPTPIDVWLDKLAMCESGGRADIKILDSNKKWSYGILQYQRQTFIAYTRKYNLLPSAEDDEIMNFIYDPDYQKMLAKKMIMDGGAHHWRNCVNKIGKPPI